MPPSSFSLLACLVVAACMATPAEAQTRSRTDVGTSLTVLEPAQVEFSANRSDDATPTVSGLDQPIVDVIRTRVLADPDSSPSVPAGARPSGGSEHRVWIISPVA